MARRSLHVPARELGEPEVTACSAILFLYEVVVGTRLAWMHEIVRAPRSAAGGALAR